MGYEVGDIVDRRYALKRLVARAQGGVVFEAQHTHLDRLVAIRLLAGDAAQDGAARAALLREAHALDLLRHPSILRVVDAARTDTGEPFLVTEPLVGRPLEGVLAVRHVLALDEALSIVRAMSSALASAHAIGLAHGGLSPASVLVRDGVAGPGAAQLIDLGFSPSPTSAFAGPLAAMGYASAERLQGASPQPSDDVYSLGALLFEMLTGELPAREAQAAASLSPDIPPAIATLVGAALAARARRYPDAGVLAAALEDARAREPIPKSIPPPQRRAHRRAGYVTPVRVRRANGEAFDGRTEDISEGGVLVLAVASAEIGDTLLVRLALPMSGRLVSLPAECRWAKAGRGSTVALGLRFVDPGAKVEEDVRAYAKFLGHDPRP